MSLSPAVAQDGIRKLSVEGRFLAPRWSPDGKMLGLTQPGYRGIYVVQTDGSGLRQISDEDAAGYRFAWSADSKQIAFKTRRSDDKGISYALKVASADGAGSKTIAERQGSMGVPVWESSDTLGVLLDGKASAAKLDGAVTEKAARVKANALSRVGGDNRYLCVEDDQVVLVEADGSRKYLTTPDDGQFYDLQLSPKADKALVHNLDGHLYLIALDGTKTDLGEGTAGSWSPDGKSILCNVSRDDGNAIVSSDVFLIDVAGKSRKQLTRTEDRIELYASFSPDGKKIAYGDAKSGSIFVQDVAKEVAQ
jgi:Tol biopolymer transport system component